MPRSCRMFYGEVHEPQGPQNAASRRARVLQASRDCWKQRAAEKQQTIRSQRVTIRDLRASRDRWKSLALLTEELSSELIRTAMEQVQGKDVEQWVQENVGDST